MTTPAGAAGAARDVAFVAPDRERYRVRAATVADHGRGPDSPLLLRHLLLDGRYGAVELRIHAADAGRPAAHDALETEIGTALAVERALGGTEPGSFFPELIGYEMDCPEPFVLYAAERGEWAGLLTHGVSLTEQLGLARGLLRAVHVLDRLGLVHRGIGPASVCWDGAAVQLWDLAAVVPSGVRREPRGAAPYAPPEQRTGRGTARAEDALWSAGQLLYLLVSGRPGAADGPPGDLARFASLAEDWSGVFAPRAADRPSVSALLARLAPAEARRDLASLADGDPLAPHRRAFDEAVARKPRPGRRGGRPGGGGR